jgi:hypothetical protein
MDSLRCIEGAEGNGGPKEIAGEENKIIRVYFLYPEKIYRTERY